MPTAIVITATSVKAGLFWSARTAALKSDMGMWNGAPPVPDDEKEPPRGAKAAEPMFLLS